MTARPLDTASDQPVDTYTRPLFGEPAGWTPASAARAPVLAKAAPANEGPDEQEQGPMHEQKDDAGVAVDLPASTAVLEHFEA